MHQIVRVVRRRGVGSSFRIVAGRAFIFGDAVLVGKLEKPTLGACLQWIYLVDIARLGIFLRILRRVRCG